MMSSWKQKAFNTRMQDENENMLRTGFTQVWGYNETTVTAVHCPWLGNSGRKTMASWFIHPKDLENLMDCLLLVARKQLHPKVLWVDEQNELYIHSPINCFRNTWVSSPNPCLDHCHLQATSKSLNFTLVLDKDELEEIVSYLWYLKNYHYKWLPSTPIPGGCLVALSQ